MILEELRTHVLQTARLLPKYNLVWMAGGTVCARDPQTGYVASPRRREVERRERAVHRAAVRRHRRLARAQLVVQVHRGGASHVAARPKVRAVVVGAGGRRREERHSRRRGRG